MTIYTLVASPVVNELTVLKALHEMPVGNIGVMEVVAHASTEAELQEKLRVTSPDLVILSDKLASEQVEKLCGNARVIQITTNKDSKPSERVKFVFPPLRPSLFPQRVVTLFRQCSEEQLAAEREARHATAEKESQAPSKSGVEAPEPNLEKQMIATEKSSRGIESLVIGGAFRRDYMEGDEPDLTGLKLFAVYSGGGMEEVTEYSYKQRKLKLSDRCITVYCGDKKISTPITVRPRPTRVDFFAPQTPSCARKVIGIQIAQMPDKTEYEQDIEEFDPNGGLLSLVYNDGEVETVPLSKAKILGFDSQNAGEQTLTAEYMGQQAVLNVLVLPKMPVSIEIARMPVKTEYESGETFDPEGLVLVATYANGDKEEAAYMVESPLPLTTEDTTASVSSMGTLLDIPIKVVQSVVQQEDDTAEPDVPAFYFSMLSLRVEGTPRF